jgi:hypothetical protein
VGCRRSGDQARNHLRRPPLVPTREGPATNREGPATNWDGPATKWEGPATNPVMAEPRLRDLATNWVLAGPTRRGVAARARQEVVARAKRLPAQATGMV